MAIFAALLHCMPGLRLLLTVIPMSLSSLGGAQLYSDHGISIARVPYPNVHHFALTHVEGHHQCCPPPYAARMREGGVLEARVGQIYHIVLREGGRSGYGWIIMFA
jgi:hypothetical protein